MEVHDWANPDSWPVLDYTDTGCYCGKGSLGTTVNPLDRLCMAEFIKQMDMDETPVKGDTKVEVHVMIFFIFFIT
ncbi:unnamed protein product [Oncorhynchus mykiss]|uniref:Uncharacterized protein n=1 Tax=Oncorhynchus mykiss TaxID=8022 RepID=A0A060X2X0_ONCMY|nr:unnamed protein product [Oncorhynchus mykiss]